MIIAITKLISRNVCLSGECKLLYYSIFVQCIYCNIYKFVQYFCKMPVLSDHFNISYGNILVFMLGSN